MQVAGSLANGICKYHKGWSTFQCTHDLYRHLQFFHVLLRFHCGMPPDNPPSATARCPTPGTEFSLPAGYKTCAPHRGIPAMSVGRSSTASPLPGPSGSVQFDVVQCVFQHPEQCGHLPAFSGHQFVHYQFDLIDTHLIFLKYFFLSKPPGCGVPPPAARCAARLPPGRTFYVQSVNKPACRCPATSGGCAG